RRARTRTPPAAAGGVLVRGGGQLRAPSPSRSPSAVPHVSARAPSEIAAALGARGAAIVAAGAQAAARTRVASRNRREEETGFMVRSRGDGTAGGVLPRSMEEYGRGGAWVSATAGGRRAQRRSASMRWAWTIPSQGDQAKMVNRPPSEATRASASCWS